MAWTIKGKVKYVQQLTKAEDTKWEAFVKHLGDGKSPADAAKALGDSDFKALRGGANQYELRLSGGKRATFIVNNSAKEISQVQVGGHT